MAENELSLKQVNELIEHVHNDMKNMRKLREEAYKKVDKMPPDKYLEAKDIVDYFEKRGKDLNDRMKDLTLTRDKILMEKKKRDRGIEKDWDRER